MISSCWAFWFSPHARGWPEQRPITGASDQPFSPHARGWPDLIQSAAAACRRFSPHARGWPVIPRVQCGEHRRSPRTRGDGPLPAYPPSLPATVLPARAGMALRCCSAAGGLTRSPRTRGDGPPAACQTTSRPSVLPARAGMARHGARPLGRRRWFSPHARGWPVFVCRFVEFLNRSPRTRGDGPS